MAESEDYSLKPLKDSSFGIKDLDLLETVGEFFDKELNIPSLALETNLIY
jgi:hypothetical protein